MECILYKPEANSIKKNDALASRGESELLVNLGWSTFIFISFDRNCVLREAVWVSSGWLPNFACFLTDTTVLPVPQGRGGECQWEE